MGIPSSSARVTAVKSKTKQNYLNCSRCEVSSEAPHFDTAVKAVHANVSGIMQCTNILYMCQSLQQYLVIVLAIPHGPHISGLSSSYRPGDKVTVSVMQIKEEEISDKVIYSSVQCLINRARAKQPKLFLLRPWCGTSMGLLSLLVALYNICYIIHNLIS